MSKKKVGEFEYVDKTTGEIIQHIDKIYTT